MPTKVTAEFNISVKDAVTGQSKTVPGTYEKEIWNAEDVLNALNDENPENVTNFLDKVTSAMNVNAYQNARIALQKKHEGPEKEIEKMAKLYVDANEKMGITLSLEEAKKLISVMVKPASAA